ncbi:response regulator transcription factor, partial [Robertmurraya massiliosenegalensis]|uniref:response regulator transcription factor n=1 Tax=Robertmurraya massiliosenegalensis TaxID=1287657 RepID=UPI00036FC0C8
MKVMMIDDEKAMHIIMKRMLSKIGEVEIVGAFQDTETAFSFLQNEEVDIVFVDISMPKESGLDFAKRLREIHPQIKLVFVTSHKEYALSAFDVYAYDYMIKPISQQRIEETVKRALAEEQVDSGESLPPLIEPLTNREEEIMALIGQGLTNKQIAKTFELTEGTVKNHLVNIFGKLQVKNRVQAI